MARLTISHYAVVSVISIIFTFIISITVGSFYISGDQVFYRQLYELFSQANFIEAYLFYASQLNAVEFIYFFSSWLASKFIQKDIFFAFINCIMTWYFVQACKKIKIYPYVVLALVTTNFYFYVLFFAAERLKFGFLFLFISFCVLSTRKKIFFSLMAVIGHAQMLIIIASTAFSQFTRRMLKKGSWYRIPKRSPLYILAGFFAVLFLFDYIAFKLPFYLKNGSVLSIIKPLLFMLASMYCSRQWKLIIPLFTPLILTSYIIGDERITIFAYFIFIYFSAQKHRGLNIPLLCFSTYFMLKSLIFIDNVINLGEGFGVN